MNNKTVNIQTMIELILMYTLYFSLMKIVKTEFKRVINLTLIKSSTVRRQQKIRNI